MNRFVALTTIDNPYDPFEQFTLWYQFDMEKQYNSCAYLARMARMFSNFSEEENDLQIEEAIDEIIKSDFRKIYKKLVKEVNENEKE